MQLSTSPSVEVLSDLGELGCDDNGNELELDLTITREMANPIMYPFFERAIVSEIINSTDGDCFWWDKAVKRMDDEHISHLWADVKANHHVKKMQEALNVFQGSWHLKSYRLLK